MWEHLTVDVPHDPAQHENSDALAEHLEQGWQVVAYVSGGGRQFGGGTTVQLHDRVLLKRRRSD